MKEHVNYGSDVWGWTIFWICVCVMIFFIPLPGFLWWSWWGFFIFLILVSLCFTPIDVSANDAYVSVHRALGTKKIPISAIQSVQLVDPAIQKSAASKGFMGYWGKGKDSKNGKYFSYFGKGNERYLITMKDGKQYMLSSHNAPQMVAYISGHLTPVTQNNP